MITEKRLAELKAHLKKKNHTMNDCVACYCDTDILETLNACFAVVRAAQRFTNTGYSNRKALTKALAPFVKDKKTWVDGPEYDAWKTEEPSK